MKKQLVIIGIVAILVSVGLSGCNSSPAEKFIGEWRSDTDYFQKTNTFYRNGSVFQTFATRNGLQYEERWSNYTIAENKLIISEDIYAFTFSDDNQKLILDGEVFKRQ